MSSLIGSQFFFPEAGIPWSKELGYFCLVPGIFNIGRAKYAWFKNWLIQGQGIMLVPILGVDE